MSKWYKLEMDMFSLKFIIKDKVITDLMPFKHINVIRDAMINDLNIQNRVKYCKYAKKRIIKFKCPIDAMAFKLRWL